MPVAACPECSAFLFAGARRTGVERNPAGSLRLPVATSLTGRACCPYPGRTGILRIDLQGDSGHAHSSSRNRIAGRTGLAAHTLRTVPFACLIWAPAAVRSRSPSRKTGPMPKWWRWMLRKLRCRWRAKMPGDLGVANVNIFYSDWFSGLAGQRYNLIVSNPPYVASGDMRTSPRAMCASSRYPHWLQARTDWTTFAASLSGRKNSWSMVHGSCWSMVMTRPTRCERYLSSVVLPKCCRQKICPG